MMAPQCLLLLLLFVANMSQGQETDQGCPPLSLTDGWIYYSSYRIPKPAGTTAEYSCDRDYTLNGESIRTCQCNGTWSGSDVTCICLVPIDCGPPPSIPNGSPQTPTSLAFETTITYSCNPGYQWKYINRHYETARCSCNGRWTEVPSCSLPRVYLSLGSAIYPVNNSLIDINSVGENADQTLVCHTDTSQCCESNSTSRSTCGIPKYGEWFNSDGEAVIHSRDVTESNTPLIYKSYGSQHIQLHFRGPNDFIPTGLYCCKIPSGYSTYLSSFVYTTFCVNIAIITSALYTMVNCGPPPLIPNGSPGTPTNLTLGGTVTYNCDNDYYLQGSSTVKCLSNNEWAPLPSCRFSCKQHYGRSYCKSLPIVQNGSPGTPTSRWTGGTVNYWCDPGYILSGSPVVTCLPDGEWSTLPLCLYYLSLNSTDYLTSLPEIPLSSIGEGQGSSLVCRTDLAACCFNEKGVWYYPNGLVISTDSARDGLYVSRENMSVSLNYRSGMATVTGGLYCCVIPTSQGIQDHCVIILVEESTLHTRVNLMGHVNISIEEYTSSTMPQTNVTPSANENEFQFNNVDIGILVGGVLAGAVTASLVICLINIFYQLSNDKRGARKQGAPAPSCDTSQPAEGDQNSEPMYEVVPDTRNYVKVSSSTSNNNCKYTQNQAYATRAVALGRVDIRT